MCWNCSIAFVVVVVVAAAAASYYYTKLTTRYPKCTYTLLKLGYAMHTQWYVIHTILLHTSGVFRFGMKYTPLYAHYLMALAPPI